MTFEPSMRRVRRAPRNNKEKSPQATSWHLAPAGGTRGWRSGLPRVCQTLARRPDSGSDIIGQLVAFVLYCPPLRKTVRYGG